MGTAPGALRSSSRTAAWLPWAGACGVFVAALAELRHGAALNSDAWAYWSGSVSLLEGRGYVDAFGLPIADWPPGYPVWLALVQAVLGVSIGSVVIADALAAATWCGFLIAWVLLRVQRAHVPAARWPAVVFAIASPLFALRGPSSELPTLALLAVALWAIERWRNAPAPGARWLAVVVAATVGMVVIRHAALALASGVAAMVLSTTELPRRRRGIAAASVVAAAILSWWSVRTALAQQDAFPWDPGTRSLAEILGAMARGVDRCIAPFPLGLVLALAAGLAGGPLQRWCVARGLPAASVRHADVVLFTLVGLVATAAMFSAVHVVDAPGPRFVRFAALLLGLVAIVIAAGLPWPRWRVLMLLVLVLPTALPAGKYVLLGHVGRNDASAERARSFLPWTATLDAHAAPGTVLADGRVVVAMPRFAWLQERLERGEQR